jgi:hypothetical protein
MDALADLEELSLASVGKGGAERKYGRPGLPAVSFYLDQEQATCQAWGVVAAETFTALGQAAIARLFLGVVNAFPPILARSFNELAHGVINKSELEGALDFIDWFQYFSPRVVAKLGSEALSKVPEASVEFLASGACVLWLPGSPIDILRGRRAVAESLRIRLRPLVAKNPKTGYPLTIPWS